MNSGAGWTCSVYQEWGSLSQMFTNRNGPGLGIPCFLERAQRDLYMRQAIHFIL